MSAVFGGDIGMLQQASELAARTLVEARRTGRRLSSLPEDCRPRTLGDGYAVQDAFRRLWCETPAGWKVGATAPAVQQLFRIAEPFFGPIYATDVHTSPARLPADRYPHMILESEFAFRFKAGLPPRAQPYDLHDIVAAVDTMLPAVEIISPRYQQLKVEPVGEAVGDCALNGGLVLGRPFAGDWTRLPLDRVPVCLTVGGEVRGRGTGADVLGHPCNVLVWCVNALSARNIGLAAGQVVSTGTCTGLAALKAGETAVADFGADVGSIEVTFSAENPDGGATSA